MFIFIKKTVKICNFYQKYTKTDSDTFWGEKVTFLGVKTIKILRWA